MGEDLSDQLLYAIFTPAIQKQYAQFTRKRTTVRPMPGGLVPADLNFLDKDSNLFYFPAALYSAGQFTYNQMANPKPCMVTKRNHDKTFILGDSGGFQILTGKLKVSGDKDRGVIFNWLETHTNLAMTLDVPTQLANDYKEFGKCLGDTLEHLRYWRSRYPKGQQTGPFLNVLQGGYPTWIQEWDDFVTSEEFSGWAIAGKNKKNLYEVMKRLLKLADSDKINKKLFWIHFLGVSDLTTACYLTAIQKNFAALLDDPGFHISFDASSPFLLAGRYDQAYTGYEVRPSGLRIRSTTLDTRNKKLIGSDEPFPYANSPIGKLLTMGDLVVKRPTKSEPGLDSLGIAMLQNHNIYVHMKAVIEANKLFAANRDNARNYFSEIMLDVRSRIYDIVRDERQFDCLEKHKKLLTMASK